MLHYHVLSERNLERLESVKKCIRMSTSIKYSSYFGTVMYLDVGPSVTMSLD